MRAIKLWPNIWAPHQTQTPSQSTFFEAEELTFICKVSDLFF